MSGGGGNTTTTQKSDPWIGQQPYLSHIYDLAGGLRQKEHYPGSTVVDQSPETLNALNMQTQRAQSGSDITRAGQRTLQGTLQGDYLHGGSGFNAAFDAAQRKITPTVQGAFEGAGRFGGGLGQVAETQALGDAFAGLYGDERNRQMNAMNYIPMMAQQDYQDINALSNVGQQREAYQGDLLQDQLNRWNFAQQAPYDVVNAQSAIFQGGGSLGGQMSTTQPTHRNRLAGAAGGAASGAAMGTMIMPGWGTAAGGIIGGLAGAFG